MLNLSFLNKYPYTDFHELNLDWVIRSIKEVAETIKQFDDWIEEHQHEYDEIMALYNEIISGHFPDSVQQAFIAWMQANALDLVGELVKTVIFNITDDGYFVAYIPESWEDILFGTSGLDEIIPGVDYGRLILSYNIP